ncbi:glycosyltransferase family 39 protein [Candidatus Poribacteria bacterium]|nr:glycosyltransferase family 39 protein [Candidatus Poribacteria bacterium]
MKSITPLQNYHPKPEHFILPVILFIAFLIRLSGIGVGLPYTSDPREVLIAEDVLNLISLESPPTIYNWPGTAWFYLIAIVGKILSIFGLVLSNSQIILIGRLLNVVLGTGTVWLTYKLGNSLYNKQVGLIAAAFLTVTMLHATNESSLAIVDIPATFCITLFLYILSRDSNLGIFTCLKLGLIGGIGIAVKYPTVFVLIAIFTFIREEHFFRKLLLILGITGFAFTLICPYWLIDVFSTEWNDFFDDFLYESGHNNKGHFGLFSAAETGLIDRFLYLGTLLKWGIGFPLALLVGCGLIWELKNYLLSIPSIWNFVSKIYSIRNVIDKKRENNPRLGIGLFIFIISYILFIGCYKVTFTRHLIILFPILIILASVFLYSINRRIGWSCGIIIWIVSLFYTCSFASIMWTQPTGQEASEWISDNIPIDNGIMRPPEVLFDWLIPDLDREMTQVESDWVMTTRADNDVFLRFYKNQQNFELIDWFPLEDVGIEETLEFYRLLWKEDSNYQLVKTFQRKPSFLGIRFSDDAPFPMNSLLHPEIRLYKRSDN